jgi:hypothetical protein
VQRKAPAERQRRYEAALSNIEGVTMTKNIGGVFATKVYAVEDGFVAIEQGSDKTVLLAPDELLTVIKELQAQYDKRAQWQEPTRG